MRREKDCKSRSGPKAVPAPAAEASPSERVGVVTRYLGKIRVAGVQLEVDIAKGDTLRFIKNKRDFEQEARSIQLNKVAVEVGPTGSVVGIEVEHPIGEGAAVYRVRKAG